MPSLPAPTCANVAAHDRLRTWALARKLCAWAHSRHAVYIVQISAAVVEAEDAERRRPKHAERLRMSESVNDEFIKRSRRMSHLREVDHIVQALGAEQVRAAEVRLLHLQMGRGGPESKW